jgi:hypothetical protein
LFKHVHGSAIRIEINICRNVPLWQARFVSNWTISPMIYFPVCLYPTVSVFVHMCVCVCVCVCVRLQINVCVNKHKYLWSITYNLHNPLLWIAIVLPSDSKNADILLSSLSIGRKTSYFFMCEWHICVMSCKYVMWWICS